MPEEIIAIDATWARLPGENADEDGWWRTAIWVQRKLETKHGCVLGMVLGSEPGKGLCRGSIDQRPDIGSERNQTSIVSSSVDHTDQRGPGSPFLFSSRSAQIARGNSTAIECSCREDY